jgi:hypothetical protein
MNCLKDIVDIISKIISSLGIIVAGTWTYRLFIKQRFGIPKIDLSIKIDHVALSEKLKLCHVSLEISNVGNVILRSDFAEIRLRQILPIQGDLINKFRPGFDPVEKDKKEIAWPLIVGREWNWEENEFEIEPGENDVIHTDFVIDSDIEVIEFYCYIRNLQKKKKGLGWTLTKIRNAKE